MQPATSRLNMVNPATRLTTGGMLDILSLSRIHGVKISVSWFEEDECYFIQVTKGDRTIRERVSHTELDNARNDELCFRNKLRYAIYRFKHE